MKSILAALLILGTASAAGAAALEDPVRRADRLRTEQLNRDAHAAAARRDGRIRAEQDRAQADYHAAQQRYQQAMENWRRRVAACKAGDLSACDRR